MKKKSIITLLLLVCLALPAMAQMVSNNNDDEVNKVDQSATKAYRPGEVIVKFKEASRVKMRSNAKGKFATAGVSQVDQVFNLLGVSEADQLMPLTGKQVSRRKMRSYSGDEVKDRDMSGLFRLRMSATAATTVEQAVAELKKLDEVEYAEPNYLVFAMADNSAVYTAEPLYDQQWGPAAINLPQLWDMPLLEGAKRPIIAILDTGIDIEHPDLAANIWTNAAEASGAEGEDDDNNGFADDVHGWDFINQTAKIADYNGHGTHCAGIAAAVGNNGIGIAGANPDAYIMPITIMQSDGTGDVATIIKGIDYATANGAEFLSMSFGGYAYSIAQEQALAKAYSKATLVAAAGNNGVCIYTGHHQFGPGPCYPAAFTFVLGVEAATEGGMAGFSNWDCDGPIYSMPWSDNNEETLHNYELRAPGVNIYSTYPKGRYKAMNGTSMACPLAAGAISRLMQCKSFEYQVINREILFGDLIHGANQQTGIMDVLAAYNIKDEDRVPTLWLVSTELNDEAEGDGDFRPDAGEIIDLWPTIRNDWGNATNIKLHLEMGDELEDSTLIEIIENDVDFGKNLSGYGKAKSDNPIRFKVADNCPDNRHIKLKLVITCDNVTESMVQNFVIVVENGVEIGGLIEHNMILYPNVHYIVTNTIAVPEGVTLTILPGCKLDFRHGTGISVAGNLIANGEPDNFIEFKGMGYSYVAKGGFNVISSSSDNPVYLRYVKLCNNWYFNYLGASFLEGVNLENCVLDDIAVVYRHAGDCYKCNVINYDCSDGRGGDVPSISACYTNIVNNQFTHYGSVNDTYCKDFFTNLNSSNIFNNDICYIYRSDYPGLITKNTPNYLGSSTERIARYHVFDMENGEGFTKIDLSNMPDRPYKEAHGIVWKVVVDGYDAQDEFDLLPPLGVGRHKFEVYFNRDDMDTTITPTLAMGVRPPYTQIGIRDGGYWSIKDSVSIYTAFLNITGKLQADGLNRIYVNGAKDGEHFEIPYENTRFNVLVQAAGSMATGFAAEPGLGSVKLTWNNENNDFDDAMGFNVYRYGEPKPQEIYSPHYDDYGNYWENDTIMVADTIRLNEMILDLDTDHFTDYEVTPGETYYYYYKVLSTDLKEYDISNVVAATPLTSTLGDANASGSVDVADVITTVNYAAGMDPKPFIFGAADVNVDEEIDILDVIGIIKIITHPNSAATASVEAVAEYSVEDGIVYVDCPVDLAGVQLMLSADREATITATDALNGFEQVGAWMDETSYLFMAYNLAGRVIPAGRHAIMNIADSDISDIRLSDKDGHNILAVPAVPTVIDHIAADQLVRRGVYDLMGRKVANDASSLPRLQPGIYIVNGSKVVVK
ncbi:MAG: S8 family serine peptidase [Muribaculaceae bacterium]|nr:S8 family serine peptidase [Muribaculaceae bacterium]